MPEIARPLDVDEEDDEAQNWGRIMTQYRFQLNRLLTPLRMYGQGDYVDQVTAELVELGIQLHYKLYGIEELPYIVRDIHW